MTTKSTIKTRDLTPECIPFLNWHREGDYLPHSWPRLIGTVRTSTSKVNSETVSSFIFHPIAALLLARTVWAYTPSPVKDDQGTVTGYVRKFYGPFWIMNQKEMATTFGCSRQTISYEVSLLRAMGLIVTQTIQDSTMGSRIYVIPVVENILALDTGESIKVSASRVVCDDAGTVKKRAFTVSPVNFVDTPPVNKVNTPLSTKLTPPLSTKLTPPVNKVDTSYIPPSAPTPIDLLLKGFPADAGAAQSPTASGKKKEARRSQPVARERDLFFDRLAEITQLSPKLKGSLLARTKKNLASVGADLDTLDRFMAYWSAMDFRGQKGQPPTCSQIETEWLKAMSWDPKTTTSTTERNKIQEALNW